MMDAEEHLDVTLGTSKAETWTIITSAIYQASNVVMARAVGCDELQVLYCVEGDRASLFLQQRPNLDLHSNEYGLSAAGVAASLVKRVETRHTSGIAFLEDAMY